MSDMHTGAVICAAIGHGSGDVASFRAADWLGLAATPTFALMALLTGVFGRPDGYALLCRARRLTAKRHGADVWTDECLPFGALAEVGRPSPTRYPPILIRRLEYQ